MSSDNKLDLQDRPVTEKSYTILPVFTKGVEYQIDEDLSLALIFWFLECEREKGGGFLRKKDAEKITQISILYHPLLITKYGDTSIVFDSCGIYSTRFKYGVAPSLTHLQSYLTSDYWSVKPESYVGGLDSQSQTFERAYEENSHEVSGWITDSELLIELSELLKVCRASNSRTDTFPQIIDFNNATRSLA